MYYTTYESIIKTSRLLGLSLFLSFGLSLSLVWAEPEGSETPDSSAVTAQPTTTPAAVPQGVTTTTPDTRAVKNPPIRRPIRRPIRSVKRARPAAKGKSATKRRKKKRRYPTARPKRALKAPPALGKIPFLPGEKLTYRVNMLKSHAGTVVFQVGKLGTLRQQRVLELSSFISSSPFLENFYPIRDSIRVFVTEREFLPLRSEFHLKEKQREVEYLSDFFPKKQRIVWKKKRKDRKGRKRTSAWNGRTPGPIYNVLSSLYALRRLPLKVGLEFEQYVWDGQRERLIHAQVIGEETVSTPGMGRLKAFKIKVIGRITGGVVSRKTLKKAPQEGTVWIGQDAHRTPLKAITPTKIGQASALLSARSIEPQ